MLLTLCYYKNDLINIIPCRKLSFFLLVYLVVHVDTIQALHVILLYVYITSQWQIYFYWLCKNKSINRLLIKLDATMKCITESLLTAVAVHYFDMGDNFDNLKAPDLI